MEAFEDYQNKYITQNKILIGTAISTLILSSIVIFIMATHKGVFFIQSKEIFKERPLAEEVCIQAFESIVSGEPKKNIIDDGILDILVKNGFDLVVDELLLVRSTEENKCRLVLKSDGKLLSFLATLSADNNNPFYYKLFRLDEIPVNGEEELWSFIFWQIR